MNLNHFYDLWNGNEQESLGIPMYSESDAKAMARKYRYYTPQKLTWADATLVKAPIKSPWWVWADPETGEMLTIPTQTMPTDGTGLELLPNTARIYVTLSAVDID